jgi:RNA polymerase sigma factor (TIGR02999 family)
MERDDPSDRAAGATGSSATAALAASIYEELRRLAYRTMAREPAASTLQPTALVHEVYLRLCAEGAHDWANRAQFFRAAAVAMRRILVERARRRGALRHGNGAQFRMVDLDLVPGAGAEPEPDLLELDEALEHLRLVDPELFALVELRYFAGLTIEETASILERSPRTVRRGWETARLFLYERILRVRAR